MLLSPSLLCISIRDEYSDKKTLTLQGNYPYGRGYSVLVKKKLIEEIKRKLKLELTTKDENQNLLADFNEDAKVILKNMKLQKHQEEESTFENSLSLNNDMFNIILIINSSKKEKAERFLLGTSDHTNKDAYYEYLETGIGRKLKDQMVAAVVDRIIDILYNLDLD